MTEKRLYDVINEVEPRGQSVTYEGIPCTARTCVTRLNRLTEENEQLNKKLQKIQDSFEVNWTQNYIEFDKDKLYIKDNNTEIRLDDRNLFIEVYIPQIDEYYRFRYIVTGRSSKMREFIKYYNSSSDDE